MGTSTDAYLVWGIQIEDGWGPGDATALREFASKHDIPLTGEAAWWLCSWWS